MLRFVDVDPIQTRLPPVYGHRVQALLSLREALDPIVQKYSELEEFIRIAKNECHFPSEHGLTREESASIYIYTMDWNDKSLFRLFNTALRETSRLALHPWLAYLQLFDTAL